MDPDVLRAKQNKLKDKMKALALLCLFKENKQTKTNNETKP